MPVGLANMSALGTQFSLSPPRGERAGVRGANPLPPAASE